MVGYWTTAPGTYHAGAVYHGQAPTAGSWHEVDVTIAGVPASSVAQFVITNHGNTTGQSMGIRPVASSLDRLLDLHEAEAIGSDNGVMHVNVDDNSKVEVYSETGAVDHYFTPVGWWVVSP